MLTRGLRLSRLCVPRALGPGRLGYPRVALVCGPLLQSPIVKLDVPGTKRHGSPGHGNAIRATPSSPISMLVFCSSAL